jgi:hypothetical protein
LTREKFKSGATVDLQHIKAHVGHDGNEAADQLANKARSLPSVIEPHTTWHSQCVLIHQGTIKEGNVLHFLKRRLEQDHLKARLQSSQSLTSSVQTFQASYSFRWMESIPHYLVTFTVKSRLNMLPTLDRLYKVFGTSKDPLVRLTYSTDKCLCGQLESVQHALIDCDLIPDKKSILQEATGAVLASLPPESTISSIDPLRFIHSNPLFAALGYLHPKASSRLAKLGIQKVDECLANLHLALLTASHETWLARCENFNINNHHAPVELRNELFQRSSIRQTLFRSRVFTLGDPPVHPVPQD